MTTGEVEISTLTSFHYFKSALTNLVSPFERFDSKPSTPVAAASAEKRSCNAQPGKVWIADQLADQKCPARNVNRCLVHVYDRISAISGSHPE